MTTAISRRSLLAGSITLSAMPKPEPEQVYVFATDGYEIRMTLEFHDRYAARGLGFTDRSLNNHFCLSAKGERNQNCVSDFTGAIAIARYKILSRVRSESLPSLREYVRSIDQSDDLPVRPPFERIIEVQRGLASDIQVFGYQGSGTPQQGQTAEQDKVWCLLRQNLYLKDRTAPFLIVHWKHTLNFIRVLDVIPDNGTSQITLHR
jgi:hypothetical protein